MKKRLETLNLLRITLAFLVFLFHLRINYGFGFGEFEGLNNFVGMGNVLMVGFFMLSGFVLFYNYNNLKWTGGGNKKILYKTFCEYLPSILSCAVVYYRDKIGFF